MVTAPVAVTSAVTWLPKRSGAREEVSFAPPRLVTPDPGCFRMPSLVLFNGPLLSSLT